MISPLLKEFLDRRDWLLAYILSLTRDRAAAEEVFQDTAVAVLEEDRKGTRPVKTAAWIREVARRRVAEFFRKRRSRAPGAGPLEELDGAVEQSFEENLIAAERNLERQRFLKECLERLSAGLRRIVFHRYGEQLSLQETAAAVGWQVDSVKVALSRARRALYECVAAKLRATERA
jgi:RNA polymerase sigma-70 factor (ECF subfamily)